MSRFGKYGHSILGAIELPGKERIMTLEDAREMIPNGFYHLVRHNGTRFKNTFALIGEEVSHQDEFGVPRSTCVFHPGDTHRDTTGCPLVGLAVHFNEDDLDIDHGAKAIIRLNEILVDEHNYITIRSLGNARI